MNSQIIRQIIESGKFPHDFKQRKLVETHISYVILGTSFAYKFKKEIKYNFLDFSTLQKRKYFCERELMLNNRLTQGMYLEVVTVRDNEEEIIIDGTDGVVIDYALKMKRMRDAKQMHVMLTKNQVNSGHIKALASLIRKFHDTTDVIQRIFEQSHFSERFNDILSVSGMVEKAIGTDAVEVIEKAVRISDEFLETHQELFKQRVANNWIRDCHGDLHSRNIFLYAKPIIFDCIEFNDEYRQIDVLDEIAFFCMDLEAQGFNQFSKLFTGNYFEKSKDEFGRDEQLLFTYYKFYRANIRAKVNALRARTSKGEESQKNLRDVMRYLQLMQRCTPYLKSV